MKIIHQLIYKESLPTIAIALVVLTFIAFSKEFQRFAQLLITSGTSIQTFMEVILIVLANVLFFTTPIALLIGIISCYSRLSADSEIISLKACGVSVFRLIGPVIVMALLLFGVTFLLTTTLAPKANNHFRTLQYDVALSQLTTEIQPRVFNERFRNFIFYVDDIDRSTETWKGIFLVENGGGSQQKVYLARRGNIFIHPSRELLQLHLEDGEIYTVSTADPSSDAITYFGSLDIPLQNLNLTPLERVPKRNREKTMAELAREMKTDGPEDDNDRRHNLELEYHRRLALPFACIVFGLLGVPLGLSTRRGGRSSGFVISLFVVFLYYLIFAYSWKAGVHYRLFPIGFGVWIANILFTVCGVFFLLSANNDHRTLRRWLTRTFLRHVNRGFFRLRDLVATVWRALRQRLVPGRTNVSEMEYRFARVMDTFILKEFLKLLALTIMGGLLLFTIFTLFELLDEIYTNQIPATKIVEYFLFVAPMILVLIIPLCILISILVFFGVLEKTSQVTALKACGISIYRMSSPIVLVTVLLSLGVFVLQEFILPYTNQRQDDLLHEIKGHQVQTYYRPDITWIMGNDRTIYHYSYFDYDRNVFADLTIFELNLRQAQLRRRLFAPQAGWNAEGREWVLYNGWERDFRQATYHFDRFQELTYTAAENPAYFKTELKRSDKMSYAELSAYIHKLRRGGFETLSLEVDLHKKISYPLVNLIMLFIGLPFSFMMGKRGALYGVAVSILTGILFWALFNVFSAIGSHGIIPSLLAAWAPNLFFGFTGFYLVLNLRT
ncbi:MAG: LptF/LptG family permease [Acidobacteria bacterium]|nr:LptF/LptG family permease [Acidobacteriota bacterium]